MSLLIFKALQSSEKKRSAQKEQAKREQLAKQYGSYL